MLLKIHSLIVEDLFGMDFLQESAVEENQDFLAYQAREAAIYMMPKLEHT